VAQNRYDQLAARWDTEKTALGILGEAQRIMQSVLYNMNEAHSSSQYDKLGVGGRFADIAERSALARAENGVAQINMLVDQARRLHGQIGDLGQINVAQGSVMGDIIFDNVFSDYAMHQKIKDSEMQL